MAGAWRRGTVWLALLALALQLALPLWHTPALAGATICTAQGLVPAPPGSPDAPLAPKHAKFCPICQIAHAAGSAVLPSPVLLAGPVVFAVVPPVPATERRVIDHPELPPALRGPPPAA